ncbi:hypothetical protein C2U69_17965 [Cupriavidus pinatubonensis]|nr:hypothetical protein C2U69_17965 [Cupriavidus pinatubonensis]
MVMACSSAIEGDVQNDERHHGAKRAAIDGWHGFLLNARWFAAANAAAACKVPCGKAQVGTEVRRAVRTARKSTARQAGITGRPMRVTISDAHAAAPCVAWQSEAVAWSDRGIGKAVGA